MVVAEGGAPERCSLLQDWPLESIPMLAEDHPQYDRRRVDRIKWQKENNENDERRYLWHMADMTSVYSAIAQSCEQSAPMFFAKIEKDCDLSIRGVEGGYFDGPLAWRMLIRHLSAGTGRTANDKDYYRTAEDVQRKFRLRDHCSANEYSRKAIAFINHILPNLPTRWPEEEVNEYLIGLLPEFNRFDARMIEAGLRDAGLFESAAARDVIINKATAVIAKDAKSQGAQRN